MVARGTKFTLEPLIGRPDLLLKPQIGASALVCQNTCGMLAFLGERLCRSLPFVFNSDTGTPLGKNGGCNSHDSDGDGSPRSYLGGPEWLRCDRNGYEIASYEQLQTNVGGLSELASREGSRFRAPGRRHGGGTGPEDEMTKDVTAQCLLCRFLTARSLTTLPHDAALPN